MSPLLIRRATTRDLDVLVHHRRRMFEDMGRPYTPDEHAVHDREYRRWAKRLMSKGEFVAWIAGMNGGAPAASGAIWLQERQPRPGQTDCRVPYLLSMYTEPDFRGRGLATRIVKEAMRWAKREGHRFMTLHASKQGRGVYSRLHWERTWEMHVKLR